jgi:hypothetical protein
LHIVADARHFGHSAFSARCAELRSFAAKNFQTVEKTVKSLAVALYARGKGSRRLFARKFSCSARSSERLG